MLQHWTSECPFWRIESGFLDVKHLRKYVALKLRIHDPLRLRMQSISVGRPATGSVHLIDDNSSLKQAGLNSDCHIVVGWADGLWVGNILPGSNHWRNFFRP